MKSLDPRSLLGIAASLLLLAFLSSCAGTENIKNCVKDEPSGFIQGLIHGLFVLPAFIISLFVNDVAVYDLNNTGHLYDLGFLIGIGAFSSKAKSSVEKVIKKKEGNNNTEDATPSENTPSIK